MTLNASYVLTLSPYYTKFPACTVSLYGINYLLGEDPGTKLAWEDALAFLSLHIWVTLQLMLHQTLFSGKVPATCLGQQGS